VDASQAARHQVRTCSFAGVAVTGPAPPPGVAHHVFVDGSGRRAIVGRVIGATVGLVALAYLSAFAFSLFGVSWVPGVSLPGVGPLWPTAHSEVHRPRDMNEPVANRPEDPAGAAAVGDTPKPSTPPLLHVVSSPRADVTGPNLVEPLSPTATTLPERVDRRAPSTTLLAAVARTGAITSTTAAAATTPSTTVVTNGPDGHVHPTPPVSTPRQPDVTSPPALPVATPATSPGPPILPQNRTRSGNAAPSAQPPETAGAPPPTASGGPRVTSPSTPAPASARGSTAVAPAASAVPPTHEGGNDASATGTGNTPAAAAPGHS
jgi:hypothetical protein